MDGGRKNETGKSLEHDSWCHRAKKPVWKSAEGGGAWLRNGTKQELYSESPDSMVAQAQNILVGKKEKLVHSASSNIVRRRRNQPLANGKRLGVGRGVCGIGGSHHHSSGVGEGTRGDSKV